MELGVDYGASQRNMRERGIDGGCFELKEVYSAGSLASSVSAEAVLFYVSLVEQFPTISNGEWKAQ